MNVHSDWKDARTAFKNQASIVEAAHQTAKNLRKDDEAKKRLVIDNIADNFNGRPAGKYPVPIPGSGGDKYIVTWNGVTITEIDFLENDITPV